MALKSGKTKKSLDIRDVGAMLTQQDELARWLQHLRENALLYVASAVFVVVCIAAGLLYRANQAAAEQLRLTAYARAMQEEAAPARLAALERIPIGRDQWSAEVLYMLGETAIRAGEYDKADQAFSRVCDEFSASEFAPRAAEGLGFLAENRGDLPEALARYREVAQKWPASFSARVQPFNIARVQERLEDFQAAVEAYQSQVELFPGSHAARKAEAALARLRESHPELFPAPESVPSADEQGVPAEDLEQDGAIGALEEVTGEAPDLTPESPDAAGLGVTAGPEESFAEAQEATAEALPEPEEEKVENTEEVGESVLGDHPE